MLVVVKTQDDFLSLVNSVDWHSAYISEMHFGTKQYEIADTDNSGAVKAGDQTLARLLVSLPEDTCALEIVVFNCEVFRMCPNQELEDEKTSTIQRRRAEADFGAFSLTGECLAYQKLDLKTVNFGQYYSTAKLYDDNEDLCAPYNLNWREILDIR